MENGLRGKNKNLQGYNLKDKIIEDFSDREIRTYDGC